MGEVRLKWTAFRRSSFSQSTRDELMGAVWKEYYARLVVFVSLFDPAARADTRGESEDLVQEIMVKVMVNLHRYNPRFSFTTWIYTVARNHCRDWLRRQRVRARHTAGCEIEETSSRFPGPEETYLAREEEAITDTYLASLTEMEQQIAFLRFVEHERYDEIGRILNMPPGTVRYRVHEIRKGLENELDKR